MAFETIHAARVCYEANRAYCMATGDHSHPTWDMIPQSQKDSLASAVEAVLCNPEWSAADVHARWLAEKKAAGWKYGPVRAPDLLEHPCLVEHGDLPKSQRVKDDLFLAVVRSLAAHTFVPPHLIKKPFVEVAEVHEAVPKEPQPKTRRRRKKPVGGEEEQ